MSNALTKDQIHVLWRKFKGMRHMPVGNVPWYMGRWCADKEPFNRDNGHDGRLVLSEEQKCLEHYAKKAHETLRELCEQLEAVEPLLRDFRENLEICSACKGAGGEEERGCDWIDCHECDGWGMVTKVN